MYFKLKLELATPFYLNHRLTLDGLLSAAVYAETGKIGEETIEHIPLVIDRGVFRGSAIFCHPHYRHERFTRIMSLRSERDLNADYFSPNKRGNQYGPIDQKRGPYKANMDSYPGIASREVYFWGEGDAERAAYMIRTFIPGIGKRANSGAGEILNVAVQEVAADRSWVTAKGAPARPLPVELWRELGQPEASVAACAVMVPYRDSPRVQAVFPQGWVA